MGGVDGGVCPELLVSPEDKRSYRIIALENGLVALLVHDPEIGELLVQRKQEIEEQGEESSADSSATQQRPKRQRAGGGFGMGCCASAPDNSDEESQSMSSADDEEGEYSDEEGGRGDEEGPKTKSAAAALTIGVGSFADPPHVQGLAHFLEHMLFMGSERYTDENEAENYLAAHGGYSNAYTDVEHTTFYFELEPGPGVLDGALDRWSAFFSCPLIKEDCLGREIDAVNSEFQGVEQNDTCRQQQLLSHDATKPGHPCCNFLWGNAKSLKSATRDDLMSFWKQHYNASISKLVILGGESLDELEAMAIKYFDELRPKDTGGSTSYSAGDRGPPNITGLTSKPRDKPPPFPPPPPAPAQAAAVHARKETIESPGSEDDASVSSTFSSNPFATESMGELLLTLPVADAHTLSLVWPLPPLRPYYQYATDDYISHILGHEGPGSLTSQLKKKGWVNELMCGVDREDGLQCNSMFSLMVVELSLTEDGLKHYQDVISAVYQYLALMRAEPGPQEWVYDELKAVREMRFRFHQEISADEYVQSLAADMLTYAPEHTLSGGFLYKEWDAGLVVALLGYMMPWNMRAILASNTDEHTARVEAAAAAAERVAKQAAKQLKKSNSKSASMNLDGQTSRAVGGKEPWFGVSFARERFAVDKMAAWAAGAAPEDSTCVVVGLHLVPPNQFIATEFSLLPATVSVEGSAVDAPLDRPTRLKLHDDASGVLSVWHKADNVFRTPRATISFRFATEGLRGSVVAAVFSALFVELIRDGFNETVYMAEQAGINIELRLTDCSLELYANGFSHKLLTCANAYLDYIRAYTISPERFKYLLEDYIRMCKNQNISPEVHATYLRLQILQREVASTCAQRLEFARNEVECNAESLQRWMKEHLIPDPAAATRKAAATAFIMGNIGVEETSTFGIAAAAAFGVSTEGSDQKFHPENRVVKLKRLTLIQATAQNKEEESSAIEYYFQLGPDTVTSENGEVQPALRKLGLLDLMSQLISEPAFDVLRTKEQLGYSVNASVRRTCGVLGFCFTVVSAKVSPFAVEKRIEAFLTTWRNEIVHSQNFDTFRDSLIAMKLQKDTTLQAESGRHWLTIIESHGTFNREQLEAAELLKITKEDVLVYFDENIAKGGRGRRLLLCRVYCSGHASKMEKEAKSTLKAAIKEFGEAEVEHVPDVETWRSTVAQRECYPTTL